MKCQKIPVAVLKVRNLKMRYMFCICGLMFLSQQQEIELGVVAPQEMEKFHRIQPTMSSGQQNPGMYNPLKSKVNIASLGVRQIQKRIASSGFSKTVDIQVEALKKAKECNPQGRWWIKAEACDVRKGLRESMRGIWAGDEDMGDGSLQALYAEYIRRCSFVKKVGTSGRSGLIVRDVERLQTEMEEDLEFLTSGAEAANGLYSKAVEGSRSSDRTMMELAWTVVGFEELIKKVRTFQVQLSVFRQMDNDSAFTDLTSLKWNMLSYLKDLFTKKGTATSHILVFMIADELRNRKLYAIPVKFMPYKSLTDSKLREMELQVEEAMRNAGMTIVGFTTDGKFNSLRTAGHLRPISVLEIIKMSRNEARHMSPNSIARFFQLNRQGNPLGQHAAVSVEDVMWMHSLMSHDSVPFERASFILRRKLFPFMHDPHPWIRDKPEESEDVMKSIMAIYLYRRKIEDLKHHLSDPANFLDYL